MITLRNHLPQCYFILQLYWWYIFRYCGLEFAWIAIESFPRIYDDYWKYAYCRHKKKSDSVFCVNEIYFPACIFLDANKVFLDMYNSFEGNKTFRLLDSREKNKTKVRI